MPNESITILDVRIHSDQPLGFDKMYIGVLEKVAKPNQVVVSVFGGPYRIGVSRENFPSGKYFSVANIYPSVGEVSVRAEVVHSCSNDSCPEDVADRRGLRFSIPGQS